MVTRVTPPGFMQAVPAGERDTITCHAYNQHAYAIGYGRHALVRGLDLHARYASLVR